MLDLHQLPPPPGSGEVTACECEGVLRTHDAVSAAKIAQNMLGCGEPILQSESSEMVRPALGTQDAQHAFTASPRLPASIALAYRERGVVGCLEQVSESCGGGSVAGAAAVALLATVRAATALVGGSKCAGLERTVSTRTQASSAGSSILCISWHCVSRRLAVGYTDDSVRILSQKPLQPLLKHRTQRTITQVHWLPYSMSVVCVACDAGVLLWSVDPSSVVTRPSGACITLLPTPNSCSPTVMAPHPQGMFVCTSGGVGVSVWDVALVTGVAVQEAGTVTHLLYSPDATQLLVVILDPPTLRVFNTSDYSFLEWLCSSSVTCCAWSECSQYIVFCTSDPCMLYAVCPDSATNTAITLADLAPITVQDTLGDSVSVGGAVKGLAWGAERLIIYFHSCPYLLLFHTLTLYSLKLAPGGMIKGPDDCLPITAAFHPTQHSLLTVVWSDNSLQHIPLAYTSRQTTSAAAAANNVSLNATLGATLNATLGYAGLNASSSNNTTLPPPAGVGFVDTNTSAVIGTPLSVFSPIASGARNSISSHGSYLSNPLLHHVTSPTPC